MKTLIIFYSLEGNCQLIANEIKKHIQADVLRLIPVKDIKPNGFGKYLWGGRQAVTKIEPELKPYTVDLDLYDTIIIGTPVWAGTYAPALRTFFATNKIEGKKIALFACYAGGKGKTFIQLKEHLAGNAFIGEKGFKDPTKQERAAVEVAVQAWVAELSEVSGA